MKKVHQSWIWLTCLPLASLALLFAVTGAAPAAAQITTARLSGMVADQSGSAVASAVVSVQEEQTGYRQTVKTSTSGEYIFPSLPVGNYVLTVDMAGYSTYVQKGIVLAVSQAATSNVELHVGSVSEQVTVTADASLVTTDSPTVGQLINQQSIVTIPLNGREVQQLVFHSRCDQCNYAELRRQLRRRNISRRAICKGEWGRIERRILFAGWRGFQRPLY